jgi:hypothetical protein
MVGLVILWNLKAGARLRCDAGRAGLPAVGKLKHGNDS